MHLTSFVAFFLALMPHTGTLPAAITDTLGLPQGTITMPGDSALLQGGCGGDPYQILAKYGCTRQNGCVPSGPNGQGGINSGLACRLTKLFDASVKAGCTPKIVSAYRSAAQQGSMCGSGGTGCLGAGKSCHQYGLAVDISTCESWLRKNAPQFELHFPYYGPHIQCKEHRVANCNPQTPPCKGGGPIADPGQGGQNNQNQSGGNSQSGGQSSSGSGQGGDPSSQGGGSPSSGGSPSGQQQPTDQPPQGQQFPPTNPTDTTPQVEATEDGTSAVLSCSPETIASGEESLLNWECPSGATSIKGGTSNSASLFNPKNALTGSLRVTPKKSTTYTATCLKSGRVLAKASCEVIVTEAKSTITARITASPKTVVEGETTDISWTSQNARSCVLTGPGIASANRSGRETSDALYENATFTLTCKPIKSTGAQLVKTVEVVVTGSDGQTQSQTSSTEQTEFVDPLK